jgi:hypothetical protein
MEVRSFSPSSFFQLHACVHRPTQGQYPREIGPGQKVSAQLEASKPAPQVVNNNQ